MCSDFGIDFVLNILDTVIPLHIIFAIGSLSFLAIL